MTDSETKFQLMTLSGCKQSNGSQQ